MKSVACLARWRVLASAFLLCVATQAAAEPWNVTVVDQDGRPVPDALVMLNDGTVMPPAAASLEVAQRNAEFEPRIAVVSRGTAVQFPNRDRARHHVYSFSSARTFEIELYKGTPSDPVAFEQNGIVTIGCNVHDWMYGVIYVIDTPFYGVSTSQGRAVVPRPAGDQFELTVWHPDQADGGVTRSVTLNADNASGTDVTISMRPTAPRPSRPSPIKPPEHR